MASTARVLRRWPKWRRSYGTVRIVAPNVEQSSMGHAITAGRPLSYRRTPIAGFDAYRVNGTPADCVALGAHQWDKVDVVLSGCNLGFNLGNAIWHSGTLAAAKQAVLLGLRGIAFSAPAGLERFDELKPWMHRVLDALLPLTGTAAGEREPAARAAGLIWTRVSVRQVRRRDRADEGSARPRDVLVQRYAAVGRRGRHRSMGGRATLGLDDAAQSRHDRSCLPRAMPRATTRWTKRSPLPLPRRNRRPKRPKRWKRTRRRRRRDTQAP